MNNSQTSLTPADLAQLHKYEADDFYCDLRRHVESKIPGLNRGRPYTLRQICGRDFWNMLEGGERNAAGIFVVRGGSGCLNNLISGYTFTDYAACV